MWRNVTGGHGPSVDSHRVAHDRQSQAHATRGGSASIIDAIERLEEQRQSNLGHTFAIVADGENGVVIVEAQANVNRAALSRIEDGIPYYVFDGAAQQTRIAINMQNGIVSVIDGGIGSGRLEARVVQYLIDQFVERETLKSRFVLSVLQARDRQDAFQHRVKLNRVLLDPVEHLIALGLIGGPCQRKSQ